MPGPDHSGDSTLEQDGKFHISTGPLPLGTRAVRVWGHACQMLGHKVSSTGAPLRGPRISLGPLDQHGKMSHRWQRTRGRADSACHRRWGLQGRHGTWSCLEPRSPGRSEGGGRLDRRQLQPEVCFALATPLPQVDPFSPSPSLASHPSEGGLRGETERS